MEILKGMTWDHARGFEPMIASAKKFCSENPDVKIIWEKRSLQAFADRPIELMAFDYDLMVIDHPHVGEASRKDLIYELNHSEDYKNELKILEQESVGLSHQSYNFNDNQYALAIDAAAPVSSYRKDLLNNIPKTFEDVIQLAEKSLVMWPIKPVDAISSFNTIAANLGNPINSKEGVFIELSIANSILEMMKKLADLVPRECLSMNPIETLDYMSTNDDILYCPLLYGYSNYSRLNFRESLIHFTDIPSFNGKENNCSGSQLGGTGLAISKSTKHLKTALKYSFWVASANCQRELYYDSGGQPGNVLAWRDDKINENCNNFFKNTLKTLDKSWLRPRYDGYMYYQDKAGTLINNFLKGENSIDFTVNAMKKEFDKSFYVNKK
jgi:multiple sugar transport system substrate-binding protein